MQAPQGYVFKGGHIKSKVDKGTPKVLWDDSLRMGVKIWVNGNKEFFRWPEVPYHPKCPTYPGFVVPEPVSDKDFKEFVKFHCGMK